MSYSRSAEAHLGLSAYVYIAVPAEPFLMQACDRPSPSDDIQESASRVDVVYIILFSLIFDKR